MTQYCKIYETTDLGKNWHVLYDETYFPNHNPETVWEMQYPAKNYLYISYDSSAIKISHDNSKTFKIIKLNNKDDDLRYFH
ncbi:MAG: sialidase family protein, partial [Candidatus Taylorbacteria bacterium]